VEIISRLDDSSVDIFSFGRNIFVFIGKFNTIAYLPNLQGPNYLPIYNAREGIIKKKATGKGEREGEKSIVIRERLT
jgi:hypothetical protein